MNQGYFRTFWMIPAVICGMVALGLAACSQSDRTIAPINSPEPRLTVHNIKIPNPPLETTRSIKATVRSGPSLMVSPTPGTSPTMMLTKTNVPGATPVKSQRTVYPTPRVTLSAVQTTTESGLYQDPVSAVFSDLAGRLALPVNHMNLVSQAPTEVQVGTPCGLSKKSESGSMPQGIVVALEILLEVESEIYRYIVQGGQIHFCDKG